jgi:hypothetical protein
MAATRGLAAILRDAAKTPLLRMRPEIASRLLRIRLGRILSKIFKDFSGNFSVTLNVLVIPVTQAFRIRTMLFPYVTEHADEA